MNPAAKRTLLVSSILILAATNAEAALVTNVLGPYNWYTDSANFTVLSPAGGVVGSGANDVIMIWDGGAYNSSTDYTGPGSTANITLSTTTPFFSYAWTAHDVQMFAPGTYSFDTTLGGGTAESAMLSVTVGTGQLGMHMLWDWNGNFNVDVFIVFSQNSIFGSGLLFSAEPSCSSNFTGTITKNCLDDSPGYGSDGAPTMNQLWTLASTDPDGDGVMGVPNVLGGPTESYSYSINANLTASPVPIPAAAWLFGSGLMGLAGIAHRKKKTT